MDIWNTVVTSVVAPLILGGAAVLWKVLDRRSSVRIAELERRINERGKAYKRDYGTIYNVLTILLANMKADRVYIIQPHPLRKPVAISVVFEVTGMGVMHVRDTVKDFDVERIPTFFAEISTREFVMYRTISEMKGNRARAQFMTMGTNAVYIRQLNDGEQWVGSLVVDYLDELAVPPDYARAQLADAADKIQYLLPPVD